MRIRSIAATGYRLFNDINIRFDNLSSKQPPKYIVLVGPNGSGKSSILQLIAHAFQLFLFHRRFEQIVTMPANSRDMFGNEVAFSRLKVPVEFENLKIDFFDPEWTIEIKKSGSIESYRRNVTGEVSGIGPFLESQASNLERSLLIGDNRVSFTFPGVSIAPSRSFEQLTSALAYTNNFDAQLAVTKEQLNNVHQWILHMRLKKDVPALWNALVPFFRKTVNYEGIDPADHDLLFSIGNDTVSFNNLSGGQRAIIVMLAKIVMHCKDSGIVMIDEPEQHLHPEWQGLLRSALLNLLPYGQAIIATHSRDIVDGLSSAEIRVVGGQS